MLAVRGIYDGKNVLVKEPELYSKDSKGDKGVVHFWELK